jgi:2-polyprenyl-3-methyl-5-hydroxy-6-metoxy-1,4-benzoquinol methylase
VKTKQYGKHSASLIQQKKSFFEDNDTHVEMQNKISSIYAKQPIRVECKNCGHSLKDGHDFIKNKIPYKICGVCSHLNGAYEDTDEFCRTVYTGDGGKGYAQTYKVGDVESFNNRLNSIYIPKAEFLYTSLVNDDIDPHKMEYLDFGSGSGYFVGALKKIGLKNISGTDVSSYQVNFGNKMLGADYLSVHDINESISFLQKTNADVVSLIGVLEELRDPRGAMECIRNNNNIKYVYILVPLFSLSVFLEIMFNNMYHRQLSGGHTHLYTEESLQYFADEFGFEILSEWWFGTDMVDLYRHISVNLEINKCSESLKSLYKEMTIPLIDSMQLELDKKHGSSEVHMLLKRKSLV